MIIYRLAIDTYSNDLTGTGAKLLGGRWNSVGVPALYCTENISLAVLEILVRTSLQNIPVNYRLIKLELPDNISPTIISNQKLKRKWKEDVSYTQWLGDQFLKANNSLLLKVPSAIVEEENNFVLNPKHVNFHKVGIISNKKFEFDKRLYLKNE